MRVYREIHGDEIRFLITDLTPVEAAALEHLQYERFGEAFGRAYPADAPGLGAAYAVLERIAPDMVAQAARSVPIPWEKALEAFLAIIEGKGLVWWLTGSAALSVRGIEIDGQVIEPGDFDLVTDDASARRLGELLADYVCEPVLPVTDWICRWWGRAFLHARFEWAGGLVGEIDPSDTSDCSPYAGTRLETVVWRGHTLRVAPLDMALATSRQRGLSERFAAIERRMAKGASLWPRDLLEPGQPTGPTGALAIVPLPSLDLAVLYFRTLFLSTPMPSISISTQSPT